MGIGIDHHYHGYLADHYGCKMRHWPSVYLGLPLNGKHTSVAFWNPIIEKVECLSTWGSSIYQKEVDWLSFKSLWATSLLNTCLYFDHPSLLVLLTNWRDFIVFLWKGCTKNRGSHLIKWDIVKSHKEHGGSGILDLEHRNSSLLAKWIWRYHKEHKALWLRVIQAKFGSLHCNH